MDVVVGCRGVTKARGRGRDWLACRRKPRPASSDANVVDVNCSMIFACSCFHTARLAFF